MSGIAIDLAGADAVLEKLRAEMSGALTPVVHQGLAGIGTQALFGVDSPSGEVKAARMAYQDAATVCVANLSTHLSNGEHLVLALEQAIEGYRQADAASAFAVVPQEHDDDPTISAGAFGSGMVSGFAVTFRPPVMPEPRDYVTPYCLDWGAYDIPRDAAILRDEGHDGAYQQVMAFRALSAGLGAHYRRILALRDELAMVWSPQESEAAMQFQQLLDQHISAVVVDAAASSTNANRFYGIVDALADAKGKIDGYHARWNEVTTDWTPEFWDHAAEQLDGMARTQLIETDTTVRDFRSGIIVTDSAKTFADPSKPEGPTGPAGSSSNGRGTVAPVPGMNPVAGPALAGAPLPVPASASNPPSMLPIPPGITPLAPSGGAWVLPGPGTGPLGRVMPMPSGPGGPSAPGGPGSVGPRGLSGPGSGVRPMTGPGGLVGGAAGPLGGGARAHGATGQGGIIGGGGARGGGKAGAGKVAPGSGREKWEVRQGVQPVIDGSQPAAPQQDFFGGNEVEFESWYAKTATPWRG